MSRIQDGKLLTFKNRTECQLILRAKYPDLFGGELEAWGAWKKEYDEVMKVACEKDRVLNYE